MAFERSKHYGLLLTNDKNGPTCTTCHGAAAGVRLSSKALEGQCASCHGAGKIAPHPEFPARGRLAVEGLCETRALLKDVRNAISQVKDPARRKSFESAAQQAEGPIIEATQARHDTGVVNASPMMTATTIETAQPSRASATARDVLV